MARSKATGSTKSDMYFESDPYENLPNNPITNDDRTYLSVHGDPPPYSVNTYTGARTAGPGSLEQQPIASLDTYNQHSNTGPGQDVHITTLHSDFKSKSLTTAYVLGTVLGFIGGHHFYLNRPRFGFLYMFTLGLFGIGWLTDLCRMPSLVSHVNNQLKDPNTFFQGPEDRDLAYTYLMWLPFGIIGVHQYYLRRWKWAVLYTFTLGLFGVGWIVDAFRIPFLVSDTNHKLLELRLHTREQGPRLKKLISAYLLWIPPLGFLGGHQYYLGRKTFGVAYTLTGGLGIVGWLADGFRMPCLLERINNRLKEDFQQAVEGKIITRDRTKYLDDAYVLHCSPFGIFGAGHFYLGQLQWGFAYFFTAGFVGIGWIVDMFRLPKHVRNVNSKRKLSDHVQIRFGPNTQIIVVTDGRIIAGSDPGAQTLVPATISVPGPLGTHEAFGTDQPPSYDSVIAETDGATGVSAVITEQGSINPVFKSIATEDDSSLTDNIESKY